MSDQIPPAGNDKVPEHHTTHHEHVPHGIHAAGHEAYSHKSANIAGLNDASHHTEHAGHHAKKADANLISQEKPLTGLDDPRIEKVKHKPFIKEGKEGRDGKDAHGKVAEVPLETRPKSDVNKVEVKLGHKKGDAEPNYVIDKEGHVKENRGADKRLDKNDHSVSIEVEAGDKLNKHQQAALDGLVKSVKKDYPNAKDTAMAQDMQDVVDRTNAGPRLPDVAPKNRGGDVGTPHGPKDWGSHAGNRGGNGGHVPTAAEARARGDYVPFSAPVDWSKLPHGLDRNNPTDRIAALISSNEGKPTSINWNDNGAGVSVGMFQANQRKGELPKLFSDFANTPDGYEALVEAFGPDMAAQIKANPEMIRKLNFNPQNELGQGLEKLVQNPAFQQLQLDQIRGKIQEASPVAQAHGITSEAGVALVADLTNQFGAGGANRFLSAADGISPNDQEGKARAIARAVQNQSRYGDRYVADLGKMRSAGLSFDNHYEA